MRSIKLAHLAARCRGVVQSFTEAWVALGTRPALHHDAQHSQLLSANFTVDKMRFHRTALRV